MSPKGEVDEMEKVHNSRMLVIGEFILFISLGMSGWWSANAILAELPTFVDQSVEGKKIANLLSVSVQIGNIFPISYKFICSYCLGARRASRILPFVVTMILLVAIGALIVSSFTWDVTGRIGGVNHSVFLMLATVIAGGVGGMSNVTYWALASRYDSHCTKAVSTGMTVGGLLAAALAVIQGAGEAPRFSAKWYFVVAAAVQGIMTLVMVPIFRLPTEEEEKEEGTDNEKTPLVSSSKEKAAINSSSEVTYKKKDMRSTLCIIICFLLYGMTYALPSLLPYIVADYVKTNHTNATSGNRTGFAEYPMPIHQPTYVAMGSEGFGYYTYFRDGPHNHHPLVVDMSKLKDNIYLAMNVLQNVGDVSGRLSTLLFVPKELSSLLALCGFAMMIFTTFCLATIWAYKLPVWFPGNWGYTLAVFCFTYYYVRGLLVTSTYLFVKQAFPRYQAENLSSNLGLAGQIGALLSNMAMFYIVQKNLIGRPGESP
eukprot:m.335241 g.335241  ORF g.335241 m.335241 type:complete len:485 (+) comp17545_c0_seq1:149-1603(+)